MVLQVVQILQHYKILLKAWEGFQSSNDCIFLFHGRYKKYIRSNGQKYCISKCILVQMTNVHSIKDIKRK